MKNIHKKIILFFFTATVYQLVFSQDSSNFELKAEINTVYNSIHVTNQELTEAKTLIDLNSRYKSSWVKKYISVEISAIQKGQLKTEKAPNDKITPKQRKLISSADLGSEIIVKVNYVPENNLQENEPKEMEFSFVIEPDFQAEFPGGKEALKKYLHKETIEKITDGSIKRYNLSAVTFTIDENGAVIDAKIFDTSLMTGAKDEKTDKILLEAICNMPRWKPATYANGAKIKQNFALSVGDHESCIVNLLNIGKLSNGDLR